MKTAISDTVIETTVKPISPAAFERRLDRTDAGFEMAMGILDDDDGIVDDKAHRDRQRHQGQIVEAVAERIEHGKVSSAYGRALPPRGEVGEVPCMRADRPAGGAW